MSREVAEQLAAMRHEVDAIERRAAALARVLVRQERLERGVRMALDYVEHYGTPRALNGEFVKRALWDILAGIDGCSKCSHPSHDGEVCRLGQGCQCAPTVDSTEGQTIAREALPVVEEE